MSLLSPPNIAMIENHTSSYWSCFGPHPPTPKKTSFLDIDYIRLYYKSIQSIYTSVYISLYIYTTYKTSLALIPKTKTRVPNPQSHVSIVDGMPCICPEHAIVEMPLHVRGENDGARRSEGLLDDGGINVFAHEDLLLPVLLVLLVLPPPVAL